MLRDIIAFVSSRTGETSRDILIREINFAWKEFWNSDDIPNSLFEITVKPIDDLARITLPWYVDQIRAVKQNWSRARITVNTPRPYYQDDVYGQSIYTWRVLGISPLGRSITNATTLTVILAQAETVVVKVVLRGPTDNAQDTREEITFQIGDTSHETTSRFTDLLSVTKDVLTNQNITINDSLGSSLVLIPNSSFEAKNTLVQITDKCTCTACINCECFDILYKAPCPYLFYDDTPVPFEEVLMAKTLEWMSMPKEGQEKITQNYAVKASNLLNQFNGNESGVEHRLDLGRNAYTSRYVGHL